MSSEKIVSNRRCQSDSFELSRGSMLLLLIARGIPKIGGVSARYRASSVSA